MEYKGIASIAMIHFWIKSTSFSVVVIMVITVPQSSHELGDEAHQVLGLTNMPSVSMS